MSLPRHQHLTRRQALRSAPALRDDAITGAIRYWDAQVDNARHTVELARTAVRHGATVLAQAEVTDLIRDGDAVIGATVEDRERSETRSATPSPLAHRHHRHRMVARQGLPPPPAARTSTTCWRASTR